MKIDCLLKCTIDIDETAPDWIKDSEDYPGGLEGLIGDCIEEYFFEKNHGENYYNPGSRIVDFDKIVATIAQKVRDQI